MKQKNSTSDATRPTSTPNAVYHNVEELALALGLGKGVVYRELRAGRIPGLKVGPRRYILPRSAIETWLRSAGDHLKVSA